MDHTHISTRRNSTLDIPILVTQLNALLTSLRIPIPLISPTDLTPSLLVAILESLMGMRIPVIERGSSSQVSKVQNMKIFLGVLETDFLQMDVGLSQIDPRRLANGELEEVCFIAELLCWIGRRMKLIKKKKKSTPPSSSLSQCDVPPRSQPLSPKSQLDIDAASIFQTGSTTTESTRPLHQNMSTFTSRLLDNESSTSSITTDHPLLLAPFQSDSHHLSHMDEKEEEGDALSLISDIPSASPEPHERDPPRCIHEVPSPLSCFAHYGSPSTPPRASFSPEGQRCCPEHSTASCSYDLSGVSPIRSPPVRYGGHIELIDEETEIASFELSRSMSTPLRWSHYTSV